MKRRKTAALCFGLLAAGWVAVLFYFSGQNSVDSDSLSLSVARRFVAWFPQIGMTAEEFNPILRKLAHMGIFALEGFWLALCLMNALRPGTGASLSMALCVLMAAANEYHQTFSEGRTCQVRDVLIDSGGALLGIAVGALLIAFARRRGRKRIAARKRRAY